MNDWFCTGLESIVLVWRDMKGKSLVREEMGWLDGKF
jgi:hypothetical protein